ncbi:MAG: GGDEF domain-containing protein [Mycobacterium sp.]
MFTAACTDPLTGLLNRAGWEIGTTDLLTRRRGASTSVTVVVLDIDSLKQINDTYGHQAGDRRIEEYAHRWRRSVPRQAVLARLGGDEFAVCIAGGTSEVVNQFLRDVERLTPGVSFGAATHNSPDVSIAELYAQADAALYQSRGRPCGTVGRTPRRTSRPSTPPAAGRFSARPGFSAPGPRPPRSS